MTTYISDAPLYGYDPVTNSVPIASASSIEPDQLRGWAEIAKRSFRKWLADQDEK